jgi:hypothetical protein
MTRPPKPSSGNPADEAEPRFSSASPREVVGVFGSIQEFGAAVDEPQSSGIDRARLSVLAGGPDVDEHLRERGFHRVQDLLDAPDLPLTSLVEPESVRTAQGALVSGLLYVGAGVGAVLAYSAAALVSMLVAVAGAGAVGATAGASSPTASASNAHTTSKHTSRMAASPSGSASSLLTTRNASPGS